MRRFLAYTACVWMALAGPAMARADQSFSAWLDVPFVHQERDGCGSASIAMVMQYWQLHNAQPAQPPEAADIQRALFSPRARGIYAADLERYLAEHGFRTFSFQGTWEDLEQQIARGRPAIVALKVRRNALHYVVVTGLDSRQNVLLKNDPAERKLVKQSRASFEREWKAAASWMLLAVPQQEGSVSSR